MKRRYLLSTAFFPPVEYFSLIAGGEACIDASENYTKQSWRNRLRFLSVEGAEDFTVPVVHGGSRRIGDIMVDWSTPWLHRLEYALETAYGSSPFFEYYRDSLFALLEKRPEALLQLNSSALDWTLESLQLPFSSETLYAAAEDFAETQVVDLRDRIHPKRPSLLPEKPHYQVFSERYGFVSGLSALDLIFNEGPESCEFV